MHSLAQSMLTPCEVPASCRSLVIDLVDDLKRWDGADDDVATELMNTSMELDALMRNASENLFGKLPGVGGSPRRARPSLAGSMRDPPTDTTLRLLLDAIRKGVQAYCSVVRMRLPCACAAADIE